MPRLTTKNPAYCRHRASGQAVVTLNGVDIYLGPYGSKASRTQYDRQIGEWLANDRKPDCSGSDISVAEVIERFWTHAELYYRHADGKPTSEIRSYKPSLRILNRLYGDTAAFKFGPLALDVVRNVMVQNGWKRRSINIHVGRVKRVFKWAGSKELVPKDLYHGLTTLSGLRAGRSDAQEAEPVRPVPLATVDATLPFLSRTVAAMVRLQLLTGMRPGELCILRTGDLDRTSDVWVYTPTHHKTKHHGHARQIFLGQRGQELLTPFLKMDPTAYCFSPTDSERERREQLHLNRKTPATYGNTIGSNRKHKPKKAPRDHYDVGSYRRAISNACELAFQPLPPLGREDNESVRSWKARLTLEQLVELHKWQQAHNWHPHQLRHTKATELRKTHGLEAVQTVLGHATLSATQVYAEKNIAVARQIASEVG